MAIHNDIDIRMKENYEFPYRYKLTKRMPVIVRIDGRSFHTFTKGFQKPYDRVLMNAMQDTCKFLCENVEGCMVGYVQSDEISLFLVDYKNFCSKGFFDYNLNKIISITASLATLEFNRSFKKHVDQYRFDFNSTIDFSSTKYYTLNETYNRAIEHGACFDSRAFNIPREEVTNYFYSRQVDASRNSVEMFGRAYFSHAQLLNKNTSEIQDMVHNKYDLNWNDCNVDEKRGACCVKEYYYIDPYTKEEVDISTVEKLNEVSKRTRWIIDRNIPIFKGDGRSYIERFVNIDEEEIDE